MPLLPCVPVPPGDLLSAAPERRPIDFADRPLCPRSEVYPPTLFLSYACWLLARSSRSPVLSSLLRSSIRFMPWRWGLPLPDSFVIDCCSFALIWSISLARSSYAFSRFEELGAAYLPLAPL